MHGFIAHSTFTCAVSDGTLSHLPLFIFRWYVMTHYGAWYAAHRYHDADEQAPVTAAVGHSFTPTRLYSSTLSVPTGRLPPADGLPRAHLFRSLFPSAWPCHARGATPASLSLCSLSPGVYLASLPHSLTTHLCGTDYLGISGLSRTVTLPLPPPPCVVVGHS